MTRLTEWLADDLGLDPRDVLHAFLGLPIAILAAAGLWFLIVFFVTLVPA